MAPIGRSFPPSSGPQRRTEPVGRTTGRGRGEHAEQRPPTARAGKLPAPIHPAPPPPASRFTRIRASSAFLAQIIAGRLGLEQTRARRRASPAVTTAAYRATGALIGDRHGRGRLSSRLA